MGMAVAAFSLSKGRSAHIEADKAVISRSSVLLRCLWGDDRGRPDRLAPNQGLAVMLVLAYDYVYKTIT